MNPYAENPLGRVARAFEAARAAGNSQSALITWGNAWGIQGQPWEVLQGIALLGKEIEAARELSERLPNPTSFRESLSKMEAAISLGGDLATQPYRIARLVEEKDVALVGTAAGVSGIPQDGPELVEEEQEDLLNNVQELRAEFSNAPFPVSEFVKAQTDLMVLGLHRYRISGRRAIAVAWGESWAQGTEARENLEALEGAGKEKAEKAVKAVGGMWARLLRAVRIGGTFFFTIMGAAVTAADFDERFLAGSTSAFVKNVFGEPTDEEIDDMEEEGEEEPPSSNAGSSEGEDGERPD